MFMKIDNHTLKQLIKDIENIGLEGLRVAQTYSQGNVSEFVDRIQFINMSNNEVGVYCDNGSRYSFGNITEEIIVNVDEYFIVAAIFRVARNKFYNKDLYEGF